MSVRVLVVDDQEPFRQAAAAVIAAADGFQLVGAAATGEASLEVLDALCPDLVLMDVRLPGMDGLEASRRIVGRRPDVRVVLVSSDDDYADAAAGCGAAGYLSKRALGPDRLRRLWLATVATPHRTDPAEPATDKETS